MAVLLFRRSAILAAAVVMALLAGLTSPAQGQTFTNIASSSGIAGMLTTLYASNSQAWLSDETFLDINNDGWLDLYLGMHGNGYAIAAINNHNSTFTMSTGSAALGNSEIHMVADINEDGKIDANTNYTDGGAQWWLNNTTAGSNVMSFTTQYPSNNAGGNQGRSNALMDINNDHKLDWLHSAPPGILIENGNGHGTFTPGSGSITVSGQVSTGATIVPIDYDKDGYTDIMATYGEYQQLNARTRVYHNNHNGTFTEVSDLSAMGLPGYMNNSDTTFSANGAIVSGVGDVNHDGKTDLIVLDNLAPKVYVNNGNGTFTAKPITLPSGATHPEYASWGVASTVDFDNDGKMDIIWNGKNFLWVLKGDGNGNFTYQNTAWGIQDLAADSVDDGNTFGDINKDGKIDIVGYTGNISDQRQLKVYLNTLTGTGHYLNVRPVGPAGDIEAIGAIITVTDPATGNIIEDYDVEDYGKQSAQNYYAYDNTERHFGLGTLGIVNVEIDFPDGIHRILTGIAADQTITVTEVPEPATALLLAPAAWLLFRRKRK